jgi:hypothetical protein
MGFCSELVNPHFADKVFWEQILGAKADVPLTGVVVTKLFALSWGLCFNGLVLDAVMSVQPLEHYADSN